MTDWLTYEWTYKEQRATFRVDMQYWNLLPVLSYTQLIAVSVSPLSPQAKSSAPGSSICSISFEKTGK